MDFTTLTIDILKMLSIVGGYGIGIILLTIIIRAAMWPLGVSQQRSMRTMQMLQPKMKAIQERYKSDPQKMQQKMMEFYKEHKFNPMAGCFPLLIQMPIFILLYSTLMSPQFIQMAGDSQFLFIKRLDATLKTTAGISKDGVLGVSKFDTFMTGKTAKVYLQGVEEPLLNPDGSIAEPAPQAPASCPHTDAFMSDPNKDSMIAQHWAEIQARNAAAQAAAEAAAAASQ